MIVAYRGPVAGGDRSAPLGRVVEAEIGTLGVLRGPVVGAERRTSR